MMEESNMSKEVTFILVIVSMAIWITVTREAEKPSKEINWWKMITLCNRQVGLNDFPQIRFNSFPQL